MASKKRLSKRRASPKKKRSDKQKGEPLEINSAITKAVAGLPRAARAMLDHVEEIKREHPRLYELMFKNVDSPKYRAFERHLERVQQRTRGGE